MRRRIRPPSPKGLLAKYLNGEWANIFEFFEKTSSWRFCKVDVETVRANIKSKPGNRASQERAVSGPAYGSIAVVYPAVDHCLLKLIEDVKGETCLIHGTGMTNQERNG
jgi:hypothetical protein